ncbi:MAG TPA: 2Fe-2S iron-sulfur cluster-binding protein [Trebonia sp.]|jgi:aerobic-type carbon monoxide dehydrogenase small subunit (CoxS/CutS family)
MTATDIEIKVNGIAQHLAVPDDELLLDLLRRRLGYTSVREGCGVGACGACTVLVDGKSVSTCLTLAVRADGAEITTAEGLPANDPVISSFVEAGALQCGYCIPGFVMMSTELLAENPQPTQEDIAEHLEGNICRCGTYTEIQAAVLAAAARKAETAAIATGPGRETAAETIAFRKGEVTVPRR